ncbi:MAG: Trm112 family protein, partial [Candidatus Ranarchaeia archaeon]
ISPSAFTYIEDQSGEKEAVSILEKLKESLKSSIEETKRDSDLSSNTGLIQHLKNLYRYFYREIDAGLMQCPSCRRWYPIGNQVHGIPEMLPDDLRDPAIDLKFLKKFQHKIPKEISEKGLPFNIHFTEKDKGHNKHH